jgi:hypothetical protein
MIYAHHLICLMITSRMLKEINFIFIFIYFLLDKLLKSVFLDQEYKWIMLKCFLGSKLHECELVEEHSSIVPSSAIIK